MMEKLTVSFSCTAEEVVRLLDLLEIMTDSLLEVYAENGLYAEQLEPPEYEDVDYEDDEIPF